MIFMKASYICNVELVQATHISDGIKAIAGVGTAYLLKHNIKHIFVLSVLRLFRCSCLSTGIGLS